MIFFIMKIKQSVNTWVHKALSNIQIISWGTFYEVQLLGLRTSYFKTLDLYCQICLKQLFLVACLLAVN